MYEFLFVADVNSREKKLFDRFVRIEDRIKKNGLENNGVYLLEPPLSIVLDWRSLNLV